MSHQQEDERHLTVIQELAGRSGSGHSLGNLSKRLRMGSGGDGPAKPLVIIEVDTNGPDQAGGIEKIEVYQGDEPARLAWDFCQRFDYDEDTCKVL